VPQRIVLHRHAWRCQSNGTSSRHAVPIIHYAPGRNLEHVDVALIGSAKHEIDMAAYVLTDWPFIQALTRTGRRKKRVPALW
jgi:phosphatidylserine/phosphatidylglycerophosphate/cardiolipin synthase-like enzyme